MHRFRVQGLTLALSLCLAGIIVSSISAAPIYFDNFSGSGVSDLHGTAPDIRPGSQTWNAANVFQDDGSISGSLTNGAHAYLPFAPASGAVYTLSMDAHVESGNDNNHFFTLGFSSTNNLEDPYFPNGLVAFMYKRTDNHVGADDVGTFLGPNAGGGATHDYDVDGVLNMKIVLNTHPALWTVQWLINDVSIRGPVAYSANPTINYVTFGAFQNTFGTVDNFLLVPEPTSLSLVAISAVSLISPVRRRRQR